MNTRTFVMGVIAVTICVILLLGMFFPAISNLSPDRTENETYLNEGPTFTYTDTEGIAHTIRFTLEGDTYLVTTDGQTSRALDRYHPATSGVASAIGIGVYEAYNDNGTLISRSGVKPTTNNTIDAFRTMALAGNTDVTAGTYQLWNFYQYTLCKIMGYAVMGNTDSQYMMGDGVTGGVVVDNGLTDSAYSVSSSPSEPECLFIENSWGNVNEFIGDTYLENRSMRVGNVIGGNEVSSVENILTENITIPTANNNYISTIHMSSEAFGIPKTSTASSATAGMGINDVSTSAVGSCTLGIGGRWTGGASAGMSCFYGNNAFSYSADRFGTRLAYVITNEHDTANYGYKITFANNGNHTIISNVQVQQNGELVSIMPNGTELNDYWDFDPETGIGPFGAYYGAINLKSGLDVDDLSERRISTEKGRLGYILDPYNLHQTLGGHTFDPTKYNVMLIIPTAYWYSDPDTNTLYIGSSADRFEGVTMAPYAHQYTIDSDVDTGNPEREIFYNSIPILIGDRSVLLLYENGEICIIGSGGEVNLGQAESTVDMTLTNDVLTYSGGTLPDVLLYATDTGECVYGENPTITEDTEIILAGEHENGYGKIGYYAKGAPSEISSVSVLSPSSGYESSEINIERNVLHTGAESVRAKLTVNWSEDSSTNSCYIISPKEVDVEYTISGTPETVTKIVLVIAVFIVMAVLLFSVRLTRY